MDWVKEFYTVTGHWWGPAGQVITDRETVRVEIAKRLGAKEGMSILELGASYGETPAAFAEEGFHVVGVEISDRVAYSDVFTKKQYKGSIKMIRDDFCKVKLNQKFDLVCYWNGFGIGTDEDQRRLLRRISEEWLEDDGFALIDILNPFLWASRDGKDFNSKPRPEEGYNYAISQHVEYDQLNNRFNDTLWLTDKPKEKFTQSIRCYSPADLKLLLEGTGLKLEYAEVKGKRLTIDQKDVLLRDAHEYLVKLSRS